MIRQRIAAWLDPEQARTNDTNLDLIGELNVLIQTLREDNNYLAAQMVADHAEFHMWRADHGRCLHPSREEENP